MEISDSLMILVALPDFFKKTIAIYKNYDIL